MYDAVVFYNHFGNGDLFETREFVREMVYTLPADMFFFAHPKNKRMFADMTSMGWTAITDAMDPMKPFVKHGQSLYINTWIGHNGKYVLPQVGCVIDKSYEMFNDTLTATGHKKLSMPFLDYLPKVDFSFFYTDNINKFIIDNMAKKKVLICNGVVNSLQAENFNFTYPILEVVRNNPDTIFITTEHLLHGFDNLFSTDMIIRSPDGFDLNEISYLAKFVDVIIGRKSGPFVFAHNREVWYDWNKKSLSFTYAKHSSHFVQGDELPLRKYWSPATLTSDVIQEMEKVIG